MLRTTCVGRWLGGLLTIAAVAGASCAQPAPPTVRAQVQPGSAAASLVEWSDALWDRADRGQLEIGENLSAELPAGVQGVGELDSLREAIAHLRDSISKRESLRREEQAETRKELAEALTDDDLVNALKAVVELDALKTEGQDLLDEPMLFDVVDRSAQAAAVAEQEGDWLNALTYYSRLNALYEKDQRYEDDALRVGRRIAMLRLYMPERLYELRNRQRIAEGEDPLPQYNDLGEDWRIKLKGVDQQMVRQSLSRAATGHVERIPMSDMLVGGLDALETLVSTSDLAEAFQSIRDEGQRTLFETELDVLRGRALRATDRDRLFTLSQTLDQLVAANNRTLRLPESVLLHEFGNGAMSALDEYSAIIWPDERERFNRSLEAAFTGVGIQISLNDALELEVVTPLSGTPAFNAGIKAEDVITYIDGRSTLGISLSQAVDQITGPEDSIVTLTIRRPGADEEFDVRLVRARIPIHSVKGWRRTGTGELDWDWFIDRSAGIGYIRLSEFNKDTYEETKRAIRSMQRDGGLDGLILDLRYNPGGLLSGAVDIVNLFVDSGTIVTQEDRTGETRDRRSARWNRQIVEDDVPVIVLINGGSASASEIVSGAIQDLGRGLVVGDRSFGKGSVQEVWQVGARNAALFKLTTHYYKLPGGRLIHRGRANTDNWGVEPDVTVKVLPKQISDALDVRRESDIYTEGANGELVFADPTPLLADGLDPQLETALLLLRSRVTVAEAVAAMTREGR